MTGRSIEDRPSGAAAIYRYEVPVDGRWHTLQVPAMGHLLHVGCRIRDVVEFWAIHAGMVEPRTYRVVGTGEPFDLNETIYHGTAIVPDGDLVWHLVERLERR